MQSFKNVVYIDPHSLSEVYKMNLKTTDKKGQALFSAGTEITDSLHSVIVFACSVYELLFRTWTDVNSTDGIFLICSLGV